MSISGPRARPDATGEHHERVRALSADNVVLRPQLVATMSSLPSPSRSPVASPFQRLVHRSSPHDAGAGENRPTVVEQQLNRRPLAREQQVGIAIAVDVRERCAGDEACGGEHTVIRGIGPNAPPWLRNSMDVAGSG